MGLLKNISHHIKQSNKPWSFFAESIGIHKDDIESIGKTDNPDKEFVHAFTRKIWSEILEVGDIKYQDYSHYTQISSITRFATFLSGSTDAANGIETKASAGDKVTKFSSCGTDAANGTETKVANVEKEDDIGGGHETVQDSEVTKFLSRGADATNCTETKVANVEKVVETFEYSGGSTIDNNKVEDDIGRGHGTIQDIEDDMSKKKRKSTKDKKECLK